MWDIDGVANLRCVCGRQDTVGGALKPNNPACLVCVAPEDWIDPPLFEQSPLRFTGHASRGWGGEAACLRCGVRVSVSLDTSVSSSGPRPISGKAAHALWHLEQDWYAQVGPKAPWYAAAGYSLAEATAFTELDDPPSVADLQAIAALRALG